MTRKQRFKNIIAWFSVNMPEAETELVYSDPYQLLVAVILSAQCTDKRVNIITPPFFSRFPDVFSLAVAEREEVFNLIKSCSYPNNKAKHIHEMAIVLSKQFQGIVPSSVDELMTFPGVGRKTAHVIASVAFNQAKLAVDTHVFRVANRIGLALNATTPLAVEKQLVQHIPEDLIYKAHHWLILHGRYVCKARNPLCASCGISAFCKYYEQYQKRVVNN